MGLMTDFIISTQEDYHRYDGNPNYPKDDCFEMKDLNLLELAGIFAVLSDYKNDRLELLSTCPELY